MHGFALVRERTIPELNSHALLYRHTRTGAELLSVVNDEDNKVFGITFRTPPRNSTGVAHILEHAVLCGSRKYPVKEPFVELIKGSLKTFLNAMTYPDKTCYPVASQNLQDFYNLIDVYLDAVFYPRLAEHTLQQEGWHYQLPASDAPLTYNGVVFNEMKGNYSSPDDVLSGFSQRSLYPDTTYGHDAGGDPKVIPELTYEEFKAFHSTFYHPSNSRLFFYGNDPPEQRLRLLGEWLDNFEPLNIDSKVALQKPFAEPRRLKRTFIAGEDGARRSAMITVNWMFEELREPARDLALAILEEILIGTPASPLRKALLESGLGEDVAGDGLVDDLRQPMFSIGLKGIDARAADQVEALIMQTLSDLAKQGIAAATRDAALNTVEFRLRENNFGAFPRGIVLMLRALKFWLHDHDPLPALAFAAPLEALKAQAAGGYFEHLLQNSLLDNPHRTTMLLVADAEQGQREAWEEQQRLVAARRRMSPAEVTSTIELTHTLKRLQETPDPPEALAKIPTLKLSDVPTEHRAIPIEVTQLGSRPLLCHELPTNGVIYVDIGFDLHALEPQLLPLTALFGRALLETGAGDMDFVKLSQRIGRSTGGIRPRVVASAMATSSGGAAWLLLRAKVMPDHSEELIALLRDILLAARLDNTERLAQLVLEEKSREESRLLPAGSSLINLRLRSDFNEADWANEQIHGISYLFALRELLEQGRPAAAAIADKLLRIRSQLLKRENMLCNLTAEAAGRRRLEPALTALIEAMPSGPLTHQAWRVPPTRQAEALMLPSKVNFVAKGAKLTTLGYRPTGATQVVRKYLNTTWLWDKIRVQGGAYGGFCTLDRRSSGFTFTSYRDPNLLDTLQVFDATCRFLDAIDLNDTELTRSIIGAIGELDEYQLPDAKGFTSMIRYLVGETDEMLQQWRDEVLATRIGDFHELGAALAALAASGRIVVMASPQAIETANARRHPGLYPLKVL